LTVDELPHCHFLIEASILAMACSKQSYFIRANHYFLNTILSDWPWVCEFCAYRWNAWTLLDHSSKQSLA